MVDERTIRRDRRLRVPFAYRDRRPLERPAALVELWIELSILRGEVRFGCPFVLHVLGRPSRDVLPQQPSDKMQRSVDPRRHACCRDHLAVVDETPPRL